MILFDLDLESSAGSEITNRSSQSSRGGWSDENDIRDEEEEISRRNGGGSRRSRSPTGREWVVRRRSDGSRYVGRRRSSTPGKQAGPTDPARQSRPRPTPHRPPADCDDRRGRCAGGEPVERNVIRSRTDVDHGDYRAAEWICSPHWTDSGYRVFAVI